MSDNGPYTWAMNIIFEDDNEHVLSVLFGLRTYYYSQNA